MRDVAPRPVRGAAPRTRWGRRALLAMALVGAAGRALSAQDAPEADAPEADAPEAYRHVTLGDYATAVVGPRAIGRAVALAGFDQAVDRPNEWSRTWRHYGNRLGARAAERAMSQAVVLGLSAARHERRAEWAPCGCAGTGPRVAHALALPFRVVTREGSRSSLLVPASDLGSSLLATTLYPRGFSVRDGIRGGVTSLLFTELVSTAREFWPRRHR